MAIGGEVNLQPPPHPLVTRLASPSSQPRPGAAFVPSSCHLLTVTPGVADKVPSLLPILLSLSPIPPLPAYLRLDLGLCGSHSVASSWAQGKPRSASLELRPSVSPDAIRVEAVRTGCLTPTTDLDPRVAARGDPPRRPLLSRDASKEPNSVVLRHSDWSLFVSAARPRSS